MQKQEELDSNASALILFVCKHISFPVMARLLFFLCSKISTYSRAREVALSVYLNGMNFICRN